MRTSDDRIVLTAGDARVVVDVAAGGRISSLTFGEAELIWSGVDGRGDPDPMVWGLSPMVPFAGRISEGRFAFDGTDYALPQFHGGRAIHGYGFCVEPQSGPPNEINHAPRVLAPGDKMKHKFTLAVT